MYILANPTNHGGSAHVGSLACKPRGQARATEGHLRIWSKCHRADDNDYLPAPSFQVQPDAPLPTHSLPMVAYLDVPLPIYPFRYQSFRPATNRRPPRAGLFAGDYRITSWTRHAETNAKQKTNNITRLYKNKNKHAYKQVLYKTIWNHVLNI